MKTTVVLFGGTGDLVKLKLVPALAQLCGHGVFGDLTICGIARGDFTDQSYRDLLLSSTHTAAEKEALAKAQIVFFRKDSSQPGALAELKQKLGDLGTLQVYYLSVSYKLFIPIVENLSHAGLITPTSRIVLEKPIGESLESFKHMQKTLAKFVHEEAVYRIDHYLAKETVQSISLLKFANPLLEASFSKQLVSSIKVISHETLGVGSRLGFYEGVGATKDMIQSHLLQVCALALMERPSAMRANEISKRKLAVLKHLRVVDATFGQYASYATQLGHASETETFVRVKLACDMPRWKGVNIEIETGKHLPDKIGRVVVTYKKSTLGLDQFAPNALIIDTHPTEDIKLLVNTKKRMTNQIESVPLLFSGLTHFGPTTTDGYRRLLADIVLGDKTLFASDKEVRLCWAITEKILAKKQKVFNYPDHTLP